MVSNNFFKWWWNKRDTPERILIVFFTHSFISFLVFPFFGLSSFVFFFGGIILFVIGFLIHALIGGIRDQIRLFHKEKEEEAEEILDRLKGNCSAEGVPCTPTLDPSVQKVLAAMRAAMAAQKQKSGRP